MLFFTLLLLSVVLGLHWAYYIFIGDRPIDGIPVVGMEKGEWSSRPALMRFLKPGGKGKAMILEGLQKVRKTHSSCSRSACGELTPREPPQHNSMAGELSNYLQCGARPLYCTPNS